MFPWSPCPIAFLALCSLLANGCNEFTDNDPVFRSAAWVHTQANSQDLTILDARSSGFQDHLRGAIHAPWNYFTIGDFGSSDGGLLKPTAELVHTLQTLGIQSAKPIVVYGEWHGGWGEEGRICWMLQYLGHNMTFILSGGIQAYRLTYPGDFTSETETPDADAVWEFDFSTSHQSIRATKKLVQQEKRFIVDLRMHEEYDGTWQNPFGVIRDGHIAGAVSFPFQDLFELGCLKSCAVVIDHLTFLGWSTGQQLAAYCTAGIRSAFFWAVLKHCKVDHAANYDGSMWEWAADSALPMSVFDPTPSPTISASSGPAGNTTNQRSGSPSAPFDGTSLFPTRTPTNSPTSNPAIGPTARPPSPFTSVASDSTSSPSPSPTNSPTSSSTQNPTSKPTSSPTAGFTYYASDNPTPSPTREPIGNPTKISIMKPTSSPTSRHLPDTTESTSLSPTMSANSTPTNNPTRYPTSSATARFAPDATDIPTPSLTKSPVSNPTTNLTRNTTSSPGIGPTSDTDDGPTPSPSRSPTSNPTNNPTGNLATIAATGSTSDTTDGRKSSMTNGTTSALANSASDPVTNSANGLPPNSTTNAQWTNQTSNDSSLPSEALHPESSCCVKMPSEAIWACACFSVMLLLTPIFK